MFKTGEKPDIVVSDLHMPEMDGLALARFFNQRFRSVRFLLVTSDPPSAKDIYELGICGILKKPVLPVDLARAVALSMKPSHVSRSNE